MLELVDINKNYQIRKDKIQTVLKNVNAKFSTTGFVSILGSSGNGKTTLLNVIGGLDNIDSGKIYFNDVEIEDFEKFRRERIGYVFQEFNLVEHLTAVDNVIVGMADDIKDKKTLAKKILKDVGLEACYNKLPKQLSGGQIQRIAIARMVAKDVDIIICDEPTGSLDEDTEKSVVEMIKKLSESRLVLFVTHNEKIAATYSDRILRVKHGQLNEDSVSLTNMSLNKQESHKSFKKNVLWLALKSLFGRKNYTLKYLLLTTFILFIASLAFIFEGEFFKQFMHEASVKDGINNIIFDVTNENIDDTIDRLNEIAHIEHVTPYYNLTIGMAPTNYVDKHVSTETKVEDITDNEYIKSIVTHGRYPENASEVLMTPEGAIALISTSDRESSSRLYDQYLTGEVSADYVYSLLEKKMFLVVEYGMPRIKVVGLIDGDKMIEDWHKVYVISGFFNLFEFPGGVNPDQVKVYKDKLYRETNDEIINLVTENASVTVNETYDKMTSGVYNHIDSFLKLSKITLYLVSVIAMVSFLSLLYTSLFERKYEIGLYRALGYSKRNILKTLAYEMLMICMSSLFSVLIFLNLFSLLVLLKVDYYSSYIDILKTLNIGGIMGILVLIISSLTLIIVYTGNQLILRKSVLSNIKDL